MSLEERTLRERTLRRALHHVGDSVSQLARALVVPTDALERWLAGEEQAPAWVFLRAVDIVNDAEDCQAA